MKRYIFLICSILKYFFIYWFCQILCVVAVQRFIRILYGKAISTYEIINITNKNSIYINSLACVITLFIYIMLFRQKEKSLFKNFNFNSVNLKNHLLIMLLSIGLAAIVCSCLLLLHNRLKNYGQISNALIYNMQSLLGLICYIILMPIFEEIFFREIIFNELRNNLNIIISILIQAIIFGLSHGNLIQGIYSFIFAILAAHVYLWTNSLYSSIFFHIIFNLMASLIIPIFLCYTEKYVSIYIIAGCLLIISSLAILYKNTHNKLEIFNKILNW
ncbi:CPBP family intramembrane glutamic endopeptidase [Clostridium sporogenes]|uniref:CPBP family intramembrane glutamic endopeptidase n=1 Tax=Clostridium sporogenes TaxID=1509 RepID=UPI0013D4EE88|nr:type II CAAX endopeptidase family protein [Clostridium sporogenes]NFF68495.1 CPBP family intramembrane metalloprotease [Clostridium sporogenes]